jgi:hypothetical protein
MDERDINDCAAFIEYIASVHRSRKVRSR